MANWQASINSLADTEAVAQRLATIFDKPDRLPMFLALCGSLGAGKTQFMRFLAAHLGVAAEEVTSPTYVLMQRYHGRFPILHLDFYRLKSIEEVWDLGLDEWLERPVLVVAEWADLYQACWPENWLRLHMAVQPNGHRMLEITSQGARADRLCTDLLSTDLPRTDLPRTDLSSS